jgi:protease-4
MSKHESEHQGNDGKTDFFEELDLGMGNRDQWQRDLVNRLAFASINEQRRARRWNTFFKLLLAAYLGILLLMYWPSDWTAGGLGKEKHTALVELQGIISDQMPASADNVINGLRDAFEDKNTAGVILRINSPGGSPVQSGYINDEIRRLRKKYPDTPLYAVISDTCASGGYYVAVAADKIYADKASVVGSIGVRMDNFGFVEAIDKLGIERRLMTAGDHKGFLDPFLPENEVDVEHVQMLLDNIHNQFIDAVKTGRGKLLSDDPKIFSGLVWTGEDSVELGLVDNLGSAGYVAREVVGEEKIVDFTSKPDLFERLGERIGVALARILANSLGATGSIR